MLSREQAARLLGLAALALGCYAAWHYHEAGLTLSHYDTKGHLVVARRVIDSLTPGWKQIGAVWLPLPHLLNLLPVQVDWLYRTGASAIALSIASFALTAYACARLVLDATRSRLAAFTACVPLVMNADLLYLQSTPMTEPLLLALTTLGLVRLAIWVEADTPGNRRLAGAFLAAACLTRYEAWPVTAAALALAAIARWRLGVSIAGSLAGVARVAAYPVVASLAFLLQSRLTVGEWFVTGGFYVPDNPDLGRPFKSFGSVFWASHQLNGYLVVLVGLAGAAYVAVASLARRVRPSSLVSLALLSGAALPWYAFFSGHPFRYRYMVPLVPALAVGVGFVIGALPRRTRWALGGLLAVVLVATGRPLDPRAPMVLEAQLDRANSADRRRVSRYLLEHRRRGKVLASFGSLSHYVHELSHDGFVVRDFVHEGNGLLWMAALERPWAHVDWVLIEERSEGGDDLARRARADARFLEGFERVAEGGGVALFERRQ